jgi:hypothetical protein
MSAKKPRFAINKVPKYTVFCFPNHEAFMHVCKGKNLLEGEGAGASVMVGESAKIRLNWRIRAEITTDERLGLTLYDSKEKKQVSVYVDLKEFIRGMILGKQEWLLDDPSAYRIWE